LGAFEMRALLAGTLVSSPPATHLSWHVRGRSLGALPFEMRALLAGTRFSPPPATRLSWHVRGRSVGHSRCARSLWGRSFLRLLRPAARGMCGAALVPLVRGIRDARAPCGAARFRVERDPSPEQFALAASFSRRWDWSGLAERARKKRSLWHAVVGLSLRRPSPPPGDGDLIVACCEVAMSEDRSSIRLLRPASRGTCGGKI